MRDALSPVLLSASRQTTVLGSPRRNKHPLPQSICLTVTAGAEPLRNAGAMPKEVKQHPPLPQAKGRKVSFKNFSLLGISKAKYSICKNPANPRHDLYWKCLRIKENKSNELLCDASLFQVMASVVKMCRRTPMQRVIRFTKEGMGKRLDCVSALQQLCGKQHIQN